MVGTPNEYPYVSAHGESVATRMETDMIITPKIVTATKHVKEIKTKNRKCYFQEENFLTFYAYVVESRKPSVFYSNFFLISN